MEDLDYLHFIKKVKDNLTLDLSNYKETQMKRRLTSLRLKRGFESFAAYYNALISDPELMDEFKDRVTINVSEFWRNPNRWTVLEQRFLPELSRRSPHKLKCWSAACSTGEEPYTLAMIMAEHQIPGDILALDIDDTVLKRAQLGEYPDRSVKDVPAHYLAKYFTSDKPSSYKVSDALKPLIRFRKGNLLLDKFEKDFDLIICRNVMIYFTETAKTMLYHKFSEALKPGGLLFVGSTEQIFTPSQYKLESVDSFFYRKMSV